MLSMDGILDITYDDLFDFEKVARFGLALDGGLAHLFARELFGQWDEEEGVFDGGTWNDARRMEETLLKSPDISASKGVFYRSIQASPAEFGVPKECHGDARRVNSWVWLHIENFVDSHPIAATIAHNKAIALEMWRRFGGKSVSIRKPSAH